MLELPFRKLQEQVLRERLERDVLRVFPAAAVDGDGGRVFIVAKRERGIADLDVTPLRRKPLQAKRDVALAKDLPIEMGGGAAEGDRDAETGNRQ